ncbi:MAG: anti-sigma factor family protein [Janthinobacterium lividum]
MGHRSDLNVRTGNQTRKLEACSAWSLLLVDAAEGLLSEAEQAVLDRHVSGCAGCARELADAQRGAAWLGLLKGQTPEPPPALLKSILAKTTGATASLPSPISLSEPRAAESWPALAPPRPTFVGRPDQVRHSSAHNGAGMEGGLGLWFGANGQPVPTLQPRLAMTSAMAFLSICLTLNLLGFSFHSLRAEALRPAGIQRTVADTNASLVRSFEGIRVVYQVESRVNEWRTASTAAEGTAQGNNW